MVKLPVVANARTASSEFKTITLFSLPNVIESLVFKCRKISNMNYDQVTHNSLKSAPICNPNPTPPVAIQLGADQVPSANRESTTPEPALPDQTKPSLMMVKIASPVRIRYTVLHQWFRSRIHGSDVRHVSFRHSPCAFCSTALGIELRADSGLSGSARKDWRIVAARSHCDDGYKDDHEMVKISRPRSN